MLSPVGQQQRVVDDPDRAVAVQVGRRVALVPCKDLHVPGDRPRDMWGICYSARYRVAYPMTGPEPTGSAPNARLPATSPPYAAGGVIRHIAEVNSAGAQTSSFIRSIMIRMSAVLFVVARRRAEGILLIIRDSTTKPRRKWPCSGGS